MCGSLALDPLGGASGLSSLWSPSPLKAGVVGLLQATPRPSLPPTVQQQPLPVKGEGQLCHLPGQSSGEWPGHWGGAPCFPDT